jgi:hypothetical protein
VPCSVGEISGLFLEKAHFTHILCQAAAGFSAVCTGVFSLLPLSGDQRRTGPGPGLRPGRGPFRLGLLTAVYFITFAAAQFPLGILLDRFGPRRIEAGLLVLAAAGAFVFAKAQTLTGLVIGRGLIGFGVSACLMAAFKAFVIWFPKGQLPESTVFKWRPAAWAPLPPHPRWNGPDRNGLARGLHAAGHTHRSGGRGHLLHRTGTFQSHKDEPFADQMREMGTILRSLHFWRIAPWATLSQGTFLAVHGLWAGPWLAGCGGI